jgi:murein L,D-transpeptidase YafK
MPSIMLVVIVTASVVAASITAHASPKRSQINKKEQADTRQRLEATRKKLLAPKSEKRDFAPDSKGYHIVVKKSLRQMIIFMKGKPYKSYKVSLGFSPEGPKSRRGDGRTPEGTYFIVNRNENSAFYKSILVSYPSPTDAERAEESGLVNRWTIKSIMSAYQEHVTPPQNTKLGGNICIHGEGRRSRPAKDWTAGCVAVSNREMDEIFSLIPVGTPVTIRA